MRGRHAVGARGQDEEVKPWRGGVMLRSRREKRQKQWQDSGVVFFFFWPCWCLALKDTPLEEKL